MLYSVYFIDTDEIPTEKTTFFFFGLNVQYKDIFFVSLRYTTDNVRSHNAVGLIMEWDMLGK